MNKLAIDYSGLPEHMQGAMQRYMDHGMEPGSFLMAVLCNDLMGAIGRADEINKNRIPEYAAWLYNEAPAQSFGSIHKVDDWISSRSGAA